MNCVNLKPNEVRDLVVAYIRERDEPPSTSDLVSYACKMDSTLLDLEGREAPWQDIQGAKSAVEASIERGLARARKDGLIVFNRARPDLLGGTGRAGGRENYYSTDGEVRRLIDEVRPHEMGEMVGRVHFLRDVKSRLKMKGVLVEFGDVVLPGEKSDTIESWRLADFNKPLGQRVNPKKVAVEVSMSFESFRALIAQTITGAPS